MTAVAPPMLPAAIGDAGRLLRETAGKQAWPHGRDARFAAGWAHGSLADALHEYKELLRTGYAPLAGDEQAALDRAEAEVTDCAAALRRALAAQAAGRPA